VPVSNQQKKRGVFRDRDLLIGGISLKSKKKKMLTKDLNDQNDFSVFIPENRGGKTEKQEKMAR